MIHLYEVASQIQAELHGSCQGHGERKIWWCSTGIKFQSYKMNNFRDLVYDIIPILNNVRNT